MPGLTLGLAEMVSGIGSAELPARSCQAIRRGFADCVGVLLAGAGEEATRIVASMVPNASGPGCAPLIPSGRMVAARDAALVNGVAAHIHDFDDMSMHAHPSAVLVPAILAAGWAENASGRDALTAYAAGFELWAVLSECEPAHLQDRGFHPTAILGTLAATAAAAHLYRLDTPGIANAIAIAASLAAGVVANFGTMTKPLHAGRAAQNGLYAASLAEAGFTGSTDALEHPNGFLHAFFDSGRSSGKSFEWDGKWRLPGIGIDIKRHAIGGLSHRAADAMIALAETHALVPRDVAGIELRTGVAQTRVLRNPRPQTGLQAKFSMPFALAAALIARRIGLAELSDEFVLRPDVQAAIRKVSVVASGGESVDEPFRASERLTVTLNDGRVLSAESAPYQKGSWHLPLSDEEMLAKYTGCAGAVLEEERAKALYDALMRLEALDSLRALDDFMLVRDS